MALVPFPERTSKQIREAFDTTMQDALKVGLTSIHDASGEDQNVPFYKRCAILRLFYTSYLTSSSSVAESGELPVCFAQHDQLVGANRIAASGEPHASRSSRSSQPSMERCQTYRQLREGRSPEYMWCKALHGWFVQDVFHEPPIDRKKVHWDRGVPLCSLHTPTTLPQADC